MEFNSLIFPTKSSYTP